MASSPRHSTTPPVGTWWSNKLAGNSAVASGQRQVPAWGALLGQKKYADAEPLLLGGYDGMKTREKTMPPQATMRVVQAGERIVQLYDAWDKGDKAKEWREKLKK